MDEPCSALDPISTARVEDLMEDLKEDYTIVIVTHNMQQARRVSDLTACLMLDDAATDGHRTGILAEFSPTDLLFTNPKDKRTEAYITGRSVELRAEDSKMADEKFGSADLTGRWTGFYRYISEGMPPFPIVAEISQDGNRLSGEMYDQITEVTDTLERFLEVRRAEIPVMQALNLEQTIRLLGSRKMLVSYRLPDTSDIEGTIYGAQVAFTKWYRGTVVHQSTIDGDPFRSNEVTGHKVCYSGHLESEVGFISGRWNIWRCGFLSRLLPPKGWGTFEPTRNSYGHFEHPRAEQPRVPPYRFASNKRPDDRRRDRAQSGRQRVDGAAQRDD